MVDGVIQPVSVGDELRMRVMGTGSKGDFYGEHRGLIIFIKGLNRWAVGEQITIKVVEVKEKCAFAEKV